ncbi:IS110 family transposase [Enterococcus faecalis]|uniref:IS110 family transposase n=1 Tax=Enterococcus faecalis TaxID=1351 RepID=UPI0021DF56FA|nr:IS110 family transposase [Enterococcus faecalis]MCU9758204.1 IS110 family transposase [Enterococcus faecalis]MCU9772529.1 IS110 family transposase [Enterococcus faecalis]MCU9772802.1 IS110 family transposase [Enterococcus faecalis]MCU9792162.1 IS110 family transposase [Enterococcus faecalis]HEC4826981.1 transposase [Enterococcus faecalis]
METNTMEVKLTVCAGLDVHAKTVVACVLTGSLNSLRAKKESRTFGTRTFEVCQLGEWLVEKEDKKVILESTGQYWCPIWNVLETFELNLSFANPQRIKGIPGRKTDQKNSE